MDAASGVGRPPLRVRRDVAAPQTLSGSGMIGIDGRNKPASAVGHAASLPARLHGSSAAGGSSNGAVRAAAEAAPRVEQRLFHDSTGAVVRTPVLLSRSGEAGHRLTGAASTVAHTGHRGAALADVPAWASPTPMRNNSGNSSRHEGMSENARPESAHEERAALHRSHAASSAPGWQSAALPPALPLYAHEAAATREVVGGSGMVPSSAYVSSNFGRGHALGLRDLVASNAATPARSGDTQSAAQASSVVDAAAADAIVQLMVDSRSFSRAHSRSVSPAVYGSHSLDASNRGGVSSSSNATGASTDALFQSAAASLHFGVAAHPARAGATGVGASAAAVPSSTIRSAMADILHGMSEATAAVSARIGGSAASSNATSPFAAAHMEPPPSTGGALLRGGHGYDAFEHAAAVGMSPNTNTPLVSSTAPAVDVSNKVVMSSLLAQVAEFQAAQQSEAAANKTRLALYEALLHTLLAGGAVPPKQPTQDNEGLLSQIAALLSASPRSASGALAVAAASQTDAALASASPGAAPLQALHTAEGGSDAASHKQGLPATTAPRATPSTQADVHPTPHPRVPRVTEPAGSAAPQRIPRLPLTLPLQVPVVQQSGQTNPSPASARSRASGQCEPLDEQASPAVVAAHAAVLDATSPQASAPQRRMPAAVATRTQTLTAAAPSSTPSTAASSHSPESQLAQSNAGVSTEAGVKPAAAAPLRSPTRSPPMRAMSVASSTPTRDDQTKEHSKHGAATSDDVVAPSHASPRSPAATHSSAFMTALAAGRVPQKSSPRAPHPSDLRRVSDDLAATRAALVALREEACSEVQHMAASNAADLQQLMLQMSSMAGAGWPPVRPLPPSGRNPAAAASPSAATGAPAASPASPSTRAAVEARDGTIASLRQQLDAARAQLQVAHEEQADMVARLAVQELQVSNVSTRAETAETEAAVLRQQLQNVQRRHDDELTRWKQEAAQAQQQVQQQAQDAQRLAAKEVSSAAQRVGELEERVAMLQVEVTEAARRTSAAEQAAAAAAAAAQVTAADMGSVTDQLAEAQRECGTWQGKLAAQHVEMEAMRSRLAEYEALTARQQEQLSDMQARCTELQADARAKEELLSNMRTTARELEKLRTIHAESVARTTPKAVTTFRLGMSEDQVHSLRQTGEHVRRLATAFANLRDEVATSLSGMPAECAALASTVQAWTTRYGEHAVAPVRADAAHWRQVAEARGQELHRWANEASTESSSTNAYVASLVAQVASVEAELAAAAQASSLAMSERQALVSKLELAEGALATLHAQNAAAEAAAVRAQQLAAEATGRADALNTELVRVQEVAATHSAGLSAALEQQRTAATTAGAEAAVARKEAASARQEAAVSKAEATTLRTKLSDTSTALLEMTAQLESMSTELVETRAQAERAQHECQSAREELRQHAETAAKAQALTDQCTALSNQLDALLRDAAVARSQLADKDAQLAELTARMEANEARSYLENEANRADHEELSLMYTTLTNVQAELVAAREANKALTVELSNTRATLAHAQDAYSAEVTHRTGLPAPSHMGTKAEEGSVVSAAGHAMPSLLHTPRSVETASLASASPPTAEEGRTAALEGENRALRADLQAAHQTLAELTEAATALANDAVALRNERDEARGRVSGLTAALEACEARVSELTVEVARLQHLACAQDEVLQQTAAAVTEAAHTAHAALQSEEQSAHPAAAASDARIAGEAVPGTPAAVAAAAATDSRASEARSTSASSASRTSSTVRSAARSGAAVRTLSPAARHALTVQQSGFATSEKPPTLPAQRLSEQEVRALLEQAVDGELSPCRITQLLELAATPRARSAGTPLSSGSTQSRRNTVALTTSSPSSASPLIARALSATPQRHRAWSNRKSSPAGDLDALSQRVVQAADHEIISALPKDVVRAALDRIIGELPPLTDEDMCDLATALGDTFWEAVTALDRSGVAASSSSAAPQSPGPRATAAALVQAVATGESAPAAPPRPPTASTTAPPMPPSRALSAGRAGSGRVLPPPPPTLPPPAAHDEVDAAGLGGSGHGRTHTPVTVSRAIFTKARRVSMRS